MNWFMENRKDLARQILCGGEAGGGKGHGHCLLAIPTKERLRGGGQGNIPTARRLGGDLLDKARAVACQGLRVPVRSRRGVPGPGGVRALQGLLPPLGTVPGNLARLGPVAGLPFAVILSPQGEVVARLPDLFSSSALEAAIRQAGGARRKGVPNGAVSAESPNGEGRKGSPTSGAGRS